MSEASGRRWKQRKSRQPWMRSNLRFVMRCGLGSTYAIEHHPYKGGIQAILRGKSSDLMPSYAVRLTTSITVRLPAYLGVRHALRHDDNTDGEASDDVAVEPSKVCEQLSDQLSYKKMCTYYTE